MKSIKTGVDKLVEIIAQNKKIELEQAAKTLGVGTNVVQEWAEFLEQEGLITIDYTLSKVWLLERKITKEEVLSSVKDMSSEKESFVRKIDVAIKSLDNEALNFEEIRKKFIDIQSRIKDEIDAVKSELSELQKFDTLKANLDKDIAQQKKDYEALIAGFVSQIKQQEQKYDALLTEIDKENKTLDSYKDRVTELKKLKSESEKIIAVSMGSLKTVEKALSEGSSKVSSTDKRLSELRNIAGKLYAETNSFKVKAINESLKLLESKSSTTDKQIDALLKDAAAKTNKMGSYVSTGQKIFGNFQEFFLKNIETEKLITQIESDKNEMMKHLLSLRTKAQSLALLSKDKDIKSQFKDLESDMQAYDKQRVSFNSKIEKLIDFIKGTKS